MEKLFSNVSDKGMKWLKSGDEVVLAKGHGVALVNQDFVHPLTGAVETYDFCRKSNGVTVLPLLRNGNIVVTSQFKQGADRLVWEFPAGMKAKPKDDSASEAHIELKEESGLKTGQLDSLGTAIVAPRKFATSEELYVAIDCELLPGGPKPGPSEILELWEMTPEEFLDILDKGDGSVSGFSELAFWRASQKGYFIP